MSAGHGTSGATAQPRAPRTVHGELVSLLGLALAVVRSMLDADTQRRVWARRPGRRTQRVGVSGGTPPDPGHIRSLRTGGEVLFGEGLADEQRGGDEARKERRQLHDANALNATVKGTPHFCMPWRGTLKEFAAWAPARAVELDAGACRPVVAQCNAVLAVLHRLEHEAAHAAASWERERWAVVLRPLVDNVVLRCRHVREPASARLVGRSRLADLAARAELDGLALVQLVEGFAESLSRLMDGQGAEAVATVAAFLEKAHHEAQDLRAEAGHLSDLLPRNGGATARSDHLEQVRHRFPPRPPPAWLMSRPARICATGRLRGARPRV